MIRIIKGTYGYRRNGILEAVKPGSEPVSLSAEREAELVKCGVAEYTEVAEQEPEVNSEPEETPETPEEHEPETAQEQKTGKKHRK